MRPEDEKTLTIARRTKKNLEYIYLKKSENEDVEEFTQLLNSTFGILICLREDFIKGDNVSWEEVKNLGLINELNKLENIFGMKATERSPKLKSITSFSSLVTNLRNALAHNCFELIIDSYSKKITGVTIWNIPTAEKNIPENRVWQENISEDNLKSIVYLVLDYVDKILGDL